MPVEFLNDEQAAACGRFVDEPSQADLKRCFFLGDTNQRLVGRRRGEHTRPGFAVQLTTVRFLGTFLANPLDVPTVVDYLAAELELPDASCINGLTAKAPTLRALAPSRKIATLVATVRNRQAVPAASVGNDPVRLHSGRGADRGRAEVMPGLKGRRRVRPNEITTELLGGPWRRLCCTTRSLPEETIDLRAEA